MDHACLAFAQGNRCAPDPVGNRFSRGTPEFRLHRRDRVGGPVWAGYAVAAYMIYWATDWVWFKYIDWYVATCQREEPDTAYQAPDPIRREWARPANAIIATGRAGHWCFPNTGRMT